MIKKMYLLVHEDDSMLPLARQLHSIPESTSLPHHTGAPTWPSSQEYPADDQLQPGLSR